jgi:hypothetical protein
MTLGICAWLVFGASAASSLLGSKDPASTVGLVLIVAAMVLFIVGGALAVWACAGQEPVYTSVKSWAEEEQA